MNRRPALLPWQLAALCLTAWASLTSTPSLAAGDPMRPLGAAARPASAAGGTGVIPGVASGLRLPATSDTGPGGAARGAAPAPGASAAEAASEPPPARLLAIREDSEGRWHALVGERWLKVGDKLGPLVVRAIDMNRLVLLDGKKISTVHLLPPLQPVEAAASAPAPQAPVAAKRRPKAPSSAPGGKTPS